MINVGFVTTPLSSGHAIRGIGFYVRHLLPELKKQAPSFDFEICEIENYLKIENRKLKIIHFPFFDLFYHTLPVFRHTPTVVTVHDVIPLEFPDHYPPGLRGWANLQLQKLALSGVDRVITDSQASARAIEKYLPVSKDKIHVVYLAADERFRPIRDEKVLDRVRRKHRLPSEFVLYVGDVNWNKNIPNLILACEQINYPLVIVGEQAAQIEHLDLSHSELSHLSPHYSLLTTYPQRLGFVPDDDLVAIYNLAKVYCQPSFAEGFGLPVLEALACGAAVACSHTSSLPEIAGDSVAYFDPFNVYDMARAIKNAKPGRLAPKFSWEKAAAQTLQVYRKVLNMYRTGT